MLVQHGAYAGQKATSGNFAFGIGGKMEIEMGPCAQFCVYHLMELNPGEERLSPNVNDEEAKKGGLLRSRVVVIGKGNRLQSDDAFMADITRLERERAPSDPPRILEIPDRPKKDSLHTTLSDVSRVLRSKNAGPYEITIDAIFDSQATYKTIKSSGILSVENVARTLGVDEQDIIWAGFFEPALAYKVTIPRTRSGTRVAAGGFMEGDVHGSQQHMGLAGIKLPLELFT